MYKAYNGSTVYNCDDEEEIKKLFIGHKVKVIKNDGNEAILQLDNGVELKIISNFGCSGCGSGMYYIESLNNIDNVITNVEFEEEISHSDEYKKYGWEDWRTKSYKIFVFCENTRFTLLDVTGTDGNGYYGTGYEIRVKLLKGENKQ